MATSKKMGEKRQNIRKRFGMQKSLTKTNSMQIFSYVGYLNVSQHTQRTLLFVRWIAVARFVYVEGALRRSACFKCRIKCPNDAMTSCLDRIMTDN